jgi:hypothetical protein
MQHSNESAYIKVGTGLHHVTAMFRLRGLSTFSTSEYPYFQFQRRVYCRKRLEFQHNNVCPATRSNSIVFGGLEIQLTDTNRHDYTDSKFR